MEIYGKYIESRRNHERRKSANSTAGAENSRENKLSLLKSVLSAVFVIATSDICALLCRGLQGKDEQRDAVAECS